MIYELCYMCGGCADDYFYNGVENYIFEADSDEEAQELARLEKEANRKYHVTDVYMHSIDLPKAKDRIAELKKELGL